MNPYEQNGLDFLNKINYLVKRRDLKTKDSLISQSKAQGAIQVLLRNLLLTLIIFNR